MHQAHGIVRLHVEYWTQLSPRHCVPSRDHWRTRACEQVVHKQHTYNGRLQNAKRTYVEALRRVATLQGCSRILPSASNRDHMFSVIFLRTYWRHIKCWGKSLVFQQGDLLLRSRVQFPSWLVKKFPFLFRLCDHPHTGKLARVSLPCQGQGWCEGLHLHLVATIVWRDIPSSWQTCWTMRDYHRPHNHWTSHLHRHYTLERAVSLTVDGGLLVETSRVGEPSLISLLFLLLPPPSPSVVMTCKAHSNDTVARRS